MEYWYFCKSLNVLKDMADMAEGEHSINVCQRLRSREEIVIGSKLRELRRVCETCALSQPFIHTSRYFAPQNKYTVLSTR